MAKAKKKTAKKSVKKVVKKAAKKTAKKAPKKAAKKTPKKVPMMPALTRAPSFSLPSDSGNKVSLKDYAGKTVVLYFYPKDDTPGCTIESCDFRDSFSRVQAAGAVVLGVSKDSVASHQKFKAKFSLPFPLLSDESGKMLEAYRVWKEKLNYGKAYMGIERTTYLIDVDAKGNGTIRKVYPKVKVEGHVGEILKDLA